MEEWRTLANSPDTGSDVPDSGPGDPQGLRISESYGDTETGFHLIQFLLKLSEAQVYIFHQHLHL